MQSHSLPFRGEKQSVLLDLGVRALHRDVIFGDLAALQILVPVLGATNLTAWRDKARIGQYVAVRVDLGLGANRLLTRLA